MYVIDVEAILDSKFNIELVFMSKVVETSGTGFQFLVVKFEVYYNLVPK